jgi:integrase
MTVKIRPYKRGGLEVDIMIRLPNGETYRERRKAPTDSRSAALRWGKDRERHLLVHGPNDKSERSDAPARKEVPTLAEFAPRYMEGYAVANRHKPSTIMAKRQHLDHHLLPLFGSKRLDEITQEEIQQLKARMSGRAAKTINNVLATLSTLLKCAVEWSLIAELPVTVRRLRVPKTTMDFFDFDEYEQLVEVARTMNAGMLAFVLLAGDAGMRAGEIRGLQWDSIDLERRMLTVERAEWCGQITTPKHDKIRTIPLTQRLADALRVLERGPGPFVIYTQRGRDSEPRTLTRECQRSWLCRALRSAGLREKGPHTLRHTFCSHLATRGAPASAIQRLAGHSSLVVTERYMHLSPAALESAIRLLEAPAPNYAGARSERSGGLAVGGDMLETMHAGR